MAPDVPHFGRLADGADPMLNDMIEGYSKQGLSAEEIQTRLETDLPETLPKAGRYFLTVLKRDADRMIADRHRIQSAFQKRLVKKWGKPLKLLKMLLEAATETGDECNRTFRAAAASEQDFVFDALVQLHARSCLVANEIFCLLGGGYASGAMARWRTLHEIAVVSYFIKENGQDVAERYLMHYRIDACKSAHQYNDHCHLISGQPFPPAELATLDERRDELCKRFGKEYREDWGWAADVLKPKPANFAEIEKSVSLGHFRPYFKLASHSNHAGSKGIQFDLGITLTPPGQPVMLAGPSDAGFYDPGTCTATSVLKVTTNLLLYGQPTMMALIVSEALKQLTTDIYEAFAQADARLTAMAERRHAADS